MGFGGGCITYLIIENHNNNLEMDLEFDKAEELISLHLNLIHFFISCMLLTSNFFMITRHVYLFL